MRLLSTFAVLAALPLLAGCETGGRQTSAQVAAAAASASGPGPAGTRFDGRYTGPSNLTVGRGNACGSQTGTRTVTVRNGVAAMVYPGEITLCLLVVDPARRGLDVRYENLEGGEELFPHIYGELPLAAVIDAIPLHANTAGKFWLPQRPS